MTKHTVNMTPPHPGEFIRVEVIDDMGLTVKKATEIMGVGETTLSGLLNGDAEITPDMARRIEKAFGVGGDMLLRMQAWHDASQTQVQAREVTFGARSLAG